MHLPKLSPILWTKNLQETISFYTAVLGFESRSNFPNFASLYKDEVEIMVIVPTGEPGDDNFFSKPCLTGSIYVFMKDVDEFWKTLKGKVTIKTFISDREYGMGDFSILDNNGYEIVFGEDITSRSV